MLSRKKKIYFANLILSDDLYLSPKTRFTAKLENAIQKEFAFEVANFIIENPIEYQKSLIESYCYLIYDDLIDIFGEPLPNFNIEQIPQDLQQEVINYHNANYII